MAVALGRGKLDTNFITALAHLYVNRVNRVLEACIHIPSCPVRSAGSASTVHVRKHITEVSDREPTLPDSSIQRRRLERWIEMGHLLER